ncbi:unnamed protein product [Ectocarpus sp. 6 AP-2014]
MSPSIRPRRPGRAWASRLERRKSSSSTRSDPFRTSRTESRTSNCRRQQGEGEDQQRRRKLLRQKLDLPGAQPRGRTIPDLLLGIQRPAASTPPLGVEVVPRHQKLQQQQQQQQQQHHHYHRRQLPAKAPSPLPPRQPRLLNHQPPPMTNRRRRRRRRGISVRYTKDGKQVPIGNGGVTDRYYWTQTVNEATVYVDVPPGTRSKDVSCVIQPRWLKLKVRGAGAAGGAGAAAAAAAAAAGAAAAGAEDVVFDGELPSAVSREDSMWSLNDGKTVVISFEKTTKSWWKSVVEGDPEIDTSKVDSTTKISEYDGETQGAIRKIMFDQRQKSLGLPTSDELNADALLERAKVLPGSPFLPGGVLFEGDSGAGVVGGGGDGLGPDGVC